MACNILDEELMSDDGVDDDDDNQEGNMQLNKDDEVVLGV